MKQLLSKKFELPEVYFITDRSSIKDLPIGIPFIYGNKEDEDALIRLLEYETLFKSAKATGFPFRFEKILEENGYDDLISFWFSHPMYLEYTSEGLCDDDGELIEDLDPVTSEDVGSFRTFIRDNAVYVNIQKLKDLNVFPIWLDKLEDAIRTNIHNYAVFNDNMYNKKLEGMYGALDLVSPSKNLIVIDISGSIPKGVSSTCLALSKHLSESFYADILITGSKSTLYSYENLHELNIHTIYDENGMDNDQTWFKNLVTKDKRCYKTAIVFGDNHSPCDSWSNKYNSGNSVISREDGKKMCKWEIEKLISFHTSSSKEIAGYADWFEPKEIEHITSWVEYL